MLDRCMMHAFRPCAAFMPTYEALSERFSDSTFLTVTGDENPELRQLMRVRGRIKEVWVCELAPSQRIYTTD